MNTGSGQLPRLDVVIGNNFGHLPMFVGAEKGIFMNDATRDNADEPLGIVTRKGTGINAGKVADLKGKRIGLARGQTSDEYFKMVLRRAGMKYEDLTIENIWSQFGLAPALQEGKVDAVVSWEPYVTAALEQVADSFLVIRGGHHMSYVMVATAHGPTVTSKPATPGCCAYAAS